MSNKQEEKKYVSFTEEMKKDYTILVPNMLPMHFKLIMKILGTYGYKTELLTTEGPEIAETGLKYVHNDACYPALLVIGQFIHALQSGKYDTKKVALIYFQTGGGCRASNYVSLLRKALEKAGLEYVPVIAFSFGGIEKHPGFKMTVPILHRILYAVLYGDLLLSLVNQCKPYETNKGDTEALAECILTDLATLMDKEGVSFRQVKKKSREIVKKFASIPMTKTEKVKVGIVGEIYVKYSPLGNNNLERFLVEEGAEVVIPGLYDFLIYCLYDGILDRDLYGENKFGAFITSIACKILINFQKKISEIVAEEGTFTPPTVFTELLSRMDDKFIGIGTKMGEGWLLPAEMLELYHSGVKNIVCTQPFGCLPNHICGKGVMKPLKDAYPDINIVAIDYDPGATRVNQENRIKLMLANARNEFAVPEKKFEVKL
ncbi:MAG: 2-hydroxyglutaryl-CoA dehydratase [Ruminococcaceae bacterium]|nr:2-hydroxyglutaryl-CoA dehydratase [Oscillospiraceae bacterium]